MLHTSLCMRAVVNIGNDEEASIIFLLIEVNVPKDCNREKAIQGEERRGLEKGEMRRGYKSKLDLDASILYV